MNQDKEEEEFEEVFGEPGESPPQTTQPTTPTEAPQGQSSVPKESEEPQDESEEDFVVLEQVDLGILVSPMSHEEYPEWVPGCPVRPSGTASTVREGFCSAVTLLGCSALFSNEEVDRVDAYLQNLVEQDIFKSTSAPWNWDTPTVENIQKWFKDQKWYNPFAEMCAVIYRLERRRQLTYADDIALYAFTSKKRDKSVDDRIMKNMITLLAYVQPFPDVSSYIHDIYIFLDSLFQNQLYMAGRGNATIDESWYEPIKNIEAGFVSLCAPLGFLVARPKIYDFATTNFSFTKTVSKVFNHMGVVKDLALAAANTFMGSPLNAIDNVEKAVTDLGDLLRDRPDKKGTVTNLRRASSKFVLDNYSPYENDFSSVKVGTFIALLGKLATDVTHTPLFGKSAVPVTTEQRSRLDKVGRSILQAMRNLYVKEFEGRNLGAQLLNPLYTALRVLNSDPASGTGRAISTSNQEDSPTFTEYYEEHMKAAREEVKRGSVEVDTILLQALTSNPSLFAVFDEDGDRLDRDDFDEIVRERVEKDKELRDMTLQRDQLRKQLLSKGVATPTTPTGRPEQVAQARQPRVARGVPSVAGSTVSGYINWRSNADLRTLSYTTWAKPQDLLNLANTLQGFSFKYDTQRDRARELLVQAFPISFEVDRLHRFPMNGSYVPRDYEDVSGAVNNVLASLNYKNEDDTRGSNPRANTESSKPARQATSYSDASLNYVKALAELKDAIVRSVFTYESFEEKYGLMWCGRTTGRLTCPI